MIIRITAAVEAMALVDAPFGVAVPPYAVDLGADASGRVIEIRVEKSVPVGELQLPTVAPEPDGHTVVNLALDDPHFADLIGLVQYLESIGSFWFGIQKIDWAAGEYSWVPETDEESAALHVRSSRGRHRYNETMRRVKPEVLARTIAARPRLEHLVVPMAFFRESQREYRAFRYVPAFHNLYFFLEGLFGDGETRNPKVERAFLASPVLVSAFERARLELEKPHNLRHLQRLEQQRARKRYPWTAIGLISFVVWMRGNLHHFSIGSSTPKGHPLNQREFESVAFLLQIAGHNVVAALAR